MAFVNISLLAGGLLIGIPVILHLVMRQQPKLLEFPAIRFIQCRQESNRRRMRLRHWLLMLLRCLAIGCFAMALARPSVAAATVGNWIIVAAITLILVLVIVALLISFIQHRGRLVTTILIGFAVLLLIADSIMVGTALSQGDTVLLGDQEAPVAAVVVVDTSPRMSYRHSNMSRLEKGVETAEWLLRQLPADSDVAVLDTRPQRRVFSVDLAAAANTLKRLDLANNSRPLPEVIAEALRLVETSRKSRKEVYVFTDLTQPAWDNASAGDLRRRLEEAKDVQLYVIDVGVEKPENFSLGNVRLPLEVMTKNNDLVIESDLAAVGSGGKCIVQLRVERPDPGRPVIRDDQPLLPKSEPRQQREMTLDAGADDRVTFKLKGLPVGVHHGTIELLKKDGLAIDNQRHFSVRVTEAWQVLVLRPNGGTYVNFTEAIAPFQFRQQGRAQFVCDVVTAAEMSTKKLREYSAVILLDPGPLDDEQWQKLAKYAAQGGGVGIFLGHNARQDQTFAGEAARQLLGGKLRSQWRSPQGQFFIHRASEHPILARFKKVPDVPWEQFPVFRHWTYESLDESARVLMAYSASGQPALIEIQPGTGRVICMTTPVSDPLEPDGRETWNEVATGNSNWPYFVMINQTMRYLVKSGEVKLNYLAGETARLHNDSRLDPERYQLFSPRGELRTISAQDDSVIVRSTDQPGAYRLKGKRGEVVLRGFAVNFSDKVSDLTRTTREEIEQTLAPLRVQFVRNKEEIAFGVREERVGREFYPVLLTLLAIFLALEHLLANRFYRPDRPDTVESTALSDLRAGRGRPPQQASGTPASQSRAGATPTAKTPA